MALKSFFRFQLQAEIILDSVFHFEGSHKLAKKINFFEALSDEPEDAKLHSVQGHEPSLAMQHLHQLQRLRQQQHRQLQQQQFFNTTAEQKTLRSNSLIMSWF